VRDRTSVACYGGQACIATTGNIARAAIRERN
jgi:hypothetical protein